MSNHRGRVPFTFPISVAQGADERLRQQLPEDGTIEQIVVFFPRGTRTDLRLTLKGAEEPINEAEPTDDSSDIPDYIVGSGTTYRWDVGIEMYEGQTIGVDADNVSDVSDLDALVTMTVDYSKGVSA